MRGRPYSDLPLLPTPLIGRNAELAAAAERLDEGSRLLTFTGPPGVGKTSLALVLAAEIAHRFAGGAELVDLSPVDDAELVPSAIAEALGIAGRRPTVERLIGVLRQRTMLLILDNFEQVVEAASAVSRLLTGCPFLTLVVTSRVPLRVRWEVELAVAPLALPELHGSESPEVLAEVPAVRLFVERSLAVNQRFALTAENASAVASVCARLDGLPLAIELAAARTRLLPPSTILRQLQATQAADGRSSALELLSHGPRDLPKRQQTLRDAVAWSYNLLDSSEQRLLRRLSVFAGGCSLDAAEWVCEATYPEIDSLVEQALLQRSFAPAPLAPDADEPRVRMLQTVREFSVEQSEAATERERLEARHAAYFVELAERAEPALLGPDQAAWLDRLAADRDNLNAAGQWAATRGDVDVALRLGAALWRFWWLRGNAAEARERIDAVVALGRSGALLPGQAKALHGAGVLAHQLGDYTPARSLLEESLAVARQAGDRPTEAMVLHSLGRLGFTVGELDAAETWLTESREIAAEPGASQALAETLRILGQIAHLRADHSRAEVLVSEGLSHARASGNRRAVAQALHDLGLIAQAQGAADVARGRYEQSLAVFRAIGDRSSIAMALHNVANAALALADVETVRTCLREAIPIAVEVGDRRRICFMISAVACLMVDDDPEQAIRLDAAATAFGASIGARQSRPMRALYDARLDAALPALGEQRVALARRLGEVSTLEQAIHEALAWLGEPPAPSAPPDFATPAPTTRDRHALTRREREVAILIAQGRSNREIAEALTVAEGTAANHVQRLMNRLGLHNRAQVAAWTVEQRLHQ